MPKLNKENQKDFKRICSAFNDRNYFGEECLNEKLLEMQQRITELEQENTELKSTISTVCDKWSEQRKGQAV